MLKIENLSLKVEDKELLNDFNLEIKEGEIHAIMGPNGIGKSSICKASMKLLRVQLSLWIKILLI